MSPLKDQNTKNIFMAVFIVLWPYFLTTKLRGLQKNNVEHTITSMTSLLTHTVAHSTRPSYRPRINHQPLKKFLSLAIS